MRKEFYIEKRISPDAIKSSDNDSDYLGTVVLDVATSHKDRGNDVLTKGFLEKAVRDFKHNTSVFLNHKTSELPIGKIIHSELVKYEDGEYASRIHIGISKTASDVWTLLKEGVLNKGSIGFYLLDDGYEYDEETDILTIKSGEVVEGSIVGVPMNNKATMIEVRKMLKEERNIKHTGDDMNKEEINDILETKLKSFMDAFEEKNEKIKQDFESEKAKFEKELKDMEVKMKEIQKERDTFEKALKEGRQTSSDKNETEDVFYLKNKDMALKKSFYDLGKMITENGDMEILLYPSSEDDYFRSDK